MPVPIRTVDDLGSYLNDRLANADPRAEKGAEALLHLVGAVVTSKDPGTDLEYRATQGKPGMVMYASINGTRYAFVGVADWAIIEIRKQSLSGPVVANFTGFDCVRDVLQIVRNL
jgi:hypothetical protein